MIRYRTTLDELNAAIRDLKPTWHDRAKERTDNFRQRRGYTNQPADIWSEIKEVYMRLQHNKCAYCERQLEGPLPDKTPLPGGTSGKIEHDVEHFRPKSEVAVWPGLHGPVCDFPTGDPFPDGYYLLTYHPLNYASTCKVCNSERKATYFPIAGKRIADGESPEDLAEEKPYLLYPLGDLDDNPETILTFHLVTAIPVSKDLDKRRRAEVTINLFDLNGRANLQEGRLLVIRLLFLALERHSDPNRPATERKRMAVCIKNLLSPSAPFAGCARAFVRLYRSNPIAVSEHLNKLFPLQG